MTEFFSTRIGYGFMVTAEEVRKLTPELEEEFHDCPFSFAVDSWEPEESPYFFGITTLYLGPGAIWNMPKCDNTPGEEEIKKQFYYFFPNHSNDEVKWYILSCAD